MLDLQNHLVQDDPAEIPSMSIALTAARRHCEKYCDRQFITATYRMTFDMFPAEFNYRIGYFRDSPECEIQIPKPPLQSITSFKYINPDGIETELDPAVYEFDNNCEPGIVRLKPDQVWPSYKFVRNGIKIEFKAGYGDTDEAVPENIRAAILLVAAHLYEHRETEVTGTITQQLKFSYETLLNLERRNIRVV